MGNKIQAMYLNKNEIYIPFELRNGEKYLILNQYHALMDIDNSTYDKALKLTYDFDSKEWTYRLNGIERHKLEDKNFIELLNNELRKYKLPETFQHKYSFDYEIKVLDYVFPKTVANRKDYKSNRELSEKVNAIVREYGCLDDFILFLQKCALVLSKNVVDANQMNGNTCWELALSQIDKICKFLCSSNTTETFSLKSDGVVINIFVKKIKVDGANNRCN